MKRLLLGLVGLLALMALALALLAWKSPLPEQSPPSAEQFDQGDIERGEVLAGIGNCASCHTRDPEQPYAGGRAMPTPFGTLYSTNISPDPATGIGLWSETAFIRSMREGVARDGSHLYPAFPYTHFARVSREDLQALYAYFMTREPIQQRAPENQLGFPFDLRFLQAGWKLLFFRPEDGQPNPERSDQWNRGAYLAEGLGHCSACHTPRNALGAEQPEQAYRGALVNDWYAPGLTREAEAPVPWTRRELYSYLRRGGSPFHGVALGSMSEVVHRGLNRASDNDIQALAVYFSDLNGDPGNEQAAQAARQVIRKAQGRSQAAMSRGEALYTAACASCHYNDPDQPDLLRPELSLSSALAAPEPVNLIRATLEGVSQEDGLPGLLMPGFADALSSEDLAELFSFLRSNYSDQPSWNHLEQRIEGQRR